MTIVFQLVRRRRVVVLCAATVGLHYLAAGWVDAGGGAPPPAPLKNARAPVVAELIARAPARALAEAGAAVPMRPVQSAQRAGAAPYKADPPPSAQLTYALVRAAAGAAASSGEAVLDWTRDGAAYRLRYAGEQAPADMASEGRIGKAGIIPRTMTEKRRGRARTATHFDERGNITFSASGRAVPMRAGAQDRATWPLQLAAIARAAKGRLGAGVQIQVGEEKDAGMYRFAVLGQEEIVTAMGTLATWRLARLAAPGSYNARLDIWLAPGHQWYPVQLRSTEANGTVTTQTIRGIVVKDAGN
jgi:hypothetical protein